MARTGAPWLGRCTAGATPSRARDGPWGAWGSEGQAGSWLPPKCPHEGSERAQGHVVETGAGQGQVGHGRVEAGAVESGSRPGHQLPRSMNHTFRVPPPTGAGTGNRLGSTGSREPVPLFGNWFHAWPPFVARCPLGVAMSRMSHCFGPFHRRKNRLFKFLAREGLDHCDHRDIATTHRTTQPRTLRICTTSRRRPPTTRPRRRCSAFPRRWPSGACPGRQGTKLSSAARKSS